MEKSPVDENIVIFIGVDIVTWVSESCGAEAKPIHSFETIINVKFHPMEREWILFSSLSIFSLKNDENSGNTFNLYFSKRIGSPLKLLRNNVVDYSWGIEDHTYLEHIAITRIYASIHTGNDDISAGISPDKWLNSIDFYYSDDFFKTESLILSKGNKFLLKNHILFVVQLQDELAQTVKLYIAKARRSVLNLQEIEVPVTHLTQSTYTILDSDKESIFIHINHFNAMSPFGHIYVLNKKGKEASLSLLNNRRNSEGNADFEKIAGFHGIYLGNVLDHHKAQLIEREYRDYQGNGDFGRYLIESEKYLKTYITYDNGGKWHRIAPPEQDSEGIFTICKQECHLNLNIRTYKGYGPLYSKDNSLGLVIGTGSIGPYLLHRSDMINTYMSKDGGYLWYEVAKGSHIYEFGDHGGVIVMAEDQKPTNIIKFTWDYGKTWRKIELSQKVMVLNILSEDDNVGLHFIVIGEIPVIVEGEENNEILRKTLVFAINFEEFGLRNCEKAYNLDDIDSDYESWSPLDRSRCLLGERRVFIKRKSSKECYNGILFEKLIGKESCECTAEDWECDEGYYRENEEKDCKKMVEEAIIPSDCNDEFVIRSGYRLIPGTKCYGGLRYRNKIIKCPKELREENGVEGMRSRFKENLMIFAIFAILTVIVVLIWKKNEVMEGIRGIKLVDRIAGQVDYKELEEGGGINGDLANMLEENKNEEDIEDIIEENEKNSKYAIRDAIDTAQKQVPKIAISNK